MIFERFPEEVTIFESFPEGISFKGFSFSNYYDHEKELLQPQLEKLGYKFISWHNGERDSFGPLTRYAKATKDGKIHNFIYG